MGIASTERRNNQHLLSILSASSLAHSRPLCHTHGWLPRKSRVCLLECKGNQTRQATEIYRSGGRQRDTDGLVTGEQQDVSMCRAPSLHPPVSFLLPVDSCHSQYTKNVKLHHSLFLFLGGGYV